MRFSWTWHDDHNILVTILFLFNSPISCNLWSNDASVVAALWHGILVQCANLVFVFVCVFVFNITSFVKRNPCAMGNPLGRNAVDGSSLKLIFLLFTKLFPRIFKMYFSGLDTFFYFQLCDTTLVEPGERNAADETFSGWLSIGFLCFSPSMYLSDFLNCISLIL